MELKKNYYFWIAFALLFILIKSVLSSFFTMKTLLSAIACFISIHWFIQPYFSGRDINVPGYTHMLKKGRDDVLRMLFLISGIGLCAVAIFS